MNRIRLILYILLAFGIINSIPSTYLSAQSGVQFREDYSLEKAIQVAQIENKNIFIDTYTPWCGPCKKMNFQFQDQELGRFLNSKYINIKINMESAYGPAVKNKYDVFFLPTLLILDKFGNVKYASEGAITSDELLALSVHFHNEVYNPSLVSADFATEEDTAIAANEETILKTQTQEEMVYPSAETVKSSSVADLALSKEEKILYTQDEMNDNPDFLYNLTYLKLQLQDGSHWSAAEKYLATQNDWSTKKNMKFIYDFVRKPGSKMFQHILDNRSSYNLLFGEENVNRSISIMVNMRLYQAFPRPDQEEALFLFELLDKEVAEMAMYKYMLNRYQEEENYEAYVAIAEEYISNIDANDFEVINNLSRHYEYSSSNLDLNQVIDLMEHAIEVQGGTYYRLYDTLAALYFKKGKKKKAMANVEKALELAENSGTDLTEMLQLKSLISGL